MKNTVDLGVTAEAILQERYYQQGEDFKGLVQRVARAVSAPEKAGATRKRFEREILELLEERRFLPNSPTLMNAGLDNGQLSACFVLPVEDSLRGILNSLRDAALVHHSGGGTGFAFSRLRPAGAYLGSTARSAAGPVAFMKVFNQMTGAIRQGGRRRGANMGVLRVDHPDIEAFIQLKRDPREMENFNLSVGVTNEFMRAVYLDKSFALKEPATSREVGRMDARRVLRMISEAAWTGGDPGLLFLDRMNLFHPNAEEIEATNPCGEQPLLPYESCNLGSIALPRYVTGRGLQWERLRRDIALAVRFLDNVIEVNSYPAREVSNVTRRNRKIGLGVMGFADLLLEIGVRYDSAEAGQIATKVMSFVDRCAKEASARLAVERGAFRGFAGSKWRALGYPPLRNMTVTTVAPTGTISTIAGVSSGIEPLYSTYVERNILDGRTFIEVPTVLARRLGERSPPSTGAGWRKLAEEEFGDLWNTAGDVSVEGHLRIQAGFQRFCDSAVSKTVNLAQTATVETVEKTYLRAFELGCKGVTVYRDQSRPAQVLVGIESGSGVCVDC